ncbi:MAG: hypothetical protein CUN57_03960, partial [Phototrophicales bacterium]
GEGLSFVSLGPDVSFDTSIGLGAELGSSFDVEVVAEWLSGAILTTETVNSREISITITSSESFSTFADELIVGDAADIFIGAGFNFSIVESDILEFDPATCL